MDPAALWVTVGGVALAVGVNLYFFSPRKVVARPPAAPEPVSPPAPEPGPPLAPEASGSSASSEALEGPEPAAPPTGVSPAGPGSSGPSP